MSYVEIKQDALIIHDSWSIKDQLKANGYGFGEYGGQAYWAKTFSSMSTADDEIKLLNTLEVDWSKSAWSFADDQTKKVMLNSLLSQ